jgi:hypothetical protein
VKAKLPRLDEWMLRFEAELVRIRGEQPTKYFWPASDMPAVLERMRSAFEKGGPHYNKNGAALRATCKHFGVKVTYLAIDRFLAGTENNTRGSGILESDHLPSRGDS